VSAKNSRLFDAFVIFSRHNAPELNLVEYIWGYWKKHHLPNFCPHGFAQLSYQARQALYRMRRRPRLARAFWQQARLPL